MPILSQNPSLSIPQAFTSHVFGVFLVFLSSTKICVRYVQSGFSYYIIYKLKIFYSTIIFCNKPRPTTNLSKKITNRQSLGVSL